MNELNRNLGMLLVSVGLTVLVLILDLATPLGIAGGVPYVAVVLATLWIGDRRYTLVAAVLCTVLTGAGYFLKPTSTAMWSAVPNRLLAILAIWVASVLGLQRKRIEEALREREGQVRTILENTADAIITVDGGIVASFNPAAERIFGVRRDEMLGRPIEQVLPGYEAERPGAGPVLRRGRRSNGSEFPVELTTGEVTVEGAPVLTLVARDVTERRRLEQELLALSEQERLAIGHEMHEELGQALTGLGLISRMLARRAETGTLADPRDLAEISDQISATDELARRLFRALVPVERAEDGLPEALRRLAAEVQREFGVPCAYEQRGATGSPGHLAAIHLYRIAQEVTRDAASRTGLRGVCIALEPWHEGTDLVLELQVEPASRSRFEVPGTAEYRANIIDGFLATRHLDDGRISVRCRVPGRAGT